jgi:hypothetical protein
MIECIEGMHEDDPAKVHKENEREDEREAG